jgi:hypothetical protein
MSKNHPINELPERPPSDSSSWDRGVAEVPSAASMPVGSVGVHTELGMGGAEKQTLPPVDPTCVYTSPGQPMDKFEKSADIAAANANFEDRSDLLMRARKGTTTSD